MMRMLTAACIIILTLCTTRATHAMCHDSAECAPSGCCTVARMRYPVPTCNDLRKVGDFCRPIQKPFSATGTKPDGSFWYNVTNAYDTLCPCGPELVCLEGFCRNRN